MLMANVRCYVVGGWDRREDMGSGCTLTVSPQASPCTSLILRVLSWM